MLAATAFLAAGAGGGAQAPQLLGPASVTVSPDGDGVNDVVRLRVDSGGAPVHLEAYAWGGRLTGWRTIVRKPDTDATTLIWDVKNARGRTLRDGSYLVSVCRKGDHGLTSGPGAARPGAALRGGATHPGRSFRSALERTSPA